MISLRVDISTLAVILNSRANQDMQILWNGQRSIIGAELLLFHMMHASKMVSLKRCWMVRKTS